MKRALVASFLLACNASSIDTQDQTRAGAQPLDAARTPREVAEQALRSDKDKARSFALYAERESLVGHHETFVQTVAGLPVVGGYYQVHLGKDLTVDTVADFAKPSRSRFNGNIVLTQAQAIAIAQGAVGAGPSSAEQAAYLEENRVVWRVRVSTKTPFAAWEVLVAADDGSILRQQNRAQNATGTGYVFNPNPVDTTGKFDIPDNDNADSEFLKAARQQVELLDLDGSGFLTGTYATTVSPSARAQSASLVFDFERSQDAFEETMAYFHITTMQRYIQSLGFSNINNRVITANVNTISDDNSFYSPWDKEITFGTGGVDDAEDASIIYHEAGHAIHDNQVPGWGDTQEGRAMGEGFGDYWAASAFNKDVSNIYVGTWDAVSYNPGTPAYLRTLGTTKKYPQDMDGEVHADGEIWSACLWQLWGLVGKTRADTLVLQSHFFLTPAAKFVDGANAILQANAKLYADRDTAEIKKIFVDRGILQ